MKKSVVILGSTGSIGNTLFKILEKEKKNFEILLLSAEKSHVKLLSQAKKLKVKNLLITNKEKYRILLDKTKNTNINVYNNFGCFKKIFKKKVDYTMSSISGISGLEPTLKIIRYSKKIAIANKESIICGWNLINNELKKNKTDFIPVDSEHFSLWYGLQNTNSKSLEKVYLTASGGPFYNKPPKNLNQVKISEALNHPNWKMGKKITIDSATLINKVYEVMEANKIFNLDYQKIEILIHPKSYVHAILKFNTGMSKIIIHDTTMEIPIFNTLFFNQKKKFKTKKIDLDILNNLDFNRVNSKMFPMTKLLDLIPKKQTLYETVIVSANDKLVELFLDKKIGYREIQKKLFRIILSKKFLRFKKKNPNTFKDIVNLNNYVRLKIDENKI